jgi:hypothetical protein
MSLRFFGGLLTVEPLGRRNQRNGLAAWLKAASYSGRTDPADL